MSDSSKFTPVSASAFVDATPASAVVDATPAPESALEPAPAVDPLAPASASAPALAPASPHVLTGDADAGADADADAERPDMLCNIFEWLTNGGHPNAEALTNIIDVSNSTENLRLACQTEEAFNYAVENAEKRLKDSYEMAAAADEYEEYLDELEATDQHNHRIDSSRDSDSDSEDEPSDTTPGSCFLILNIGEDEDGDEDGDEPWAAEAAAAVPPPVPAPAAAPTAAAGAGTLTNADFRDMPPGTPLHHGKRGRILYFDRCKDGLLEKILLSKEWPPVGNERITLKEESFKDLKLHNP